MINYTSLSPSSSVCLFVSYSNRIVCQATILLGPKQGQKRQQNQRQLTDFFPFFSRFFLWMDKQSESRRVRELDRVRQCDNCQWDKTNWFIMNDSSRANKLHADTGKVHLGKRKTERKRSEARDVERYFIFMMPASEIAALALESTSAWITITKKLHIARLADAQ